VLIRKVSLSGMRFGCGMPGQLVSSLDQSVESLNASESYFRTSKCASSLLLAYGSYSPIFDYIATPENITQYVPARCITTSGVLNSSINGSPILK
jgi:hypothetical protein